MIHLYTGDGKGKTTAALGLALRAIGDGKRVFMIQFIKGPWPSGEDKSHQVFGSHFQLVKGGRGFVGILNDTLPREEHEKAARETLERARREIETREWDIVILDEVNVAVDLKLVTAQDVIGVVGFASNKNSSSWPSPGSDRTDSGLPRVARVTDGVHPSLVILTGRNAPKEFFDIADLVTEMRELKHYYNDGQIAKRGVEF